MTGSFIFFTGAPGLLLLPHCTTDWGFCTRPLTGRTRQIRVHFASIGHPIVGDVVYGKHGLSRVGGPSKLVERQFLHAWRLAFRHPIDGRELSFEAPLPEELEAALADLR